MYNHVEVSQAQTRDIIYIYIYLYIASDDEKRLEEIWNVAYNRFIKVIKKSTPEIYKNVSKQCCDLTQ